MINDVLKKLGSWSVKLRDDAPLGLHDDIEFFGHVAIIPGRIDPLQYGDDLLTLARYVGIVRYKSDNTIGGVGMAGWLGDEDGKGDVYETAVVLESETFANSIRALLPSSVTEGTLNAVAGTYSGTHRYEDPRSAIDYVCDTFEADWRVNGDGSLDAGAAADLFTTSPTAIVVRRNAGLDIELVALPGEIDAAQDAKDFTSRVVLLAEGEGNAVATGTADIIVNPYKDLQGNAVNRTRLVSESGTSTGNATARAQLQLNRFINPKRTVSLATDEFDLSGDFRPGDYVYVYDPDSGLIDTDNEVMFRGQLLNPVVIRVLSLSFPVEDGSTVAYRNGDGEWFDLTSHVEWESGNTTVDVGDNFSTALVSGAEAVRPRAQGDSSIPSPPEISSITTATYQDGDGNARANFVVSWLLPLNTDGSTIVDGDYYTVRYRVHGSATSYEYSSVEWATRTLTLNDLSPGTTYDVSVEAVDRAGNHSGYSTDEVVLASPDTIAPSEPAAPTVAGSALAIQVISDLGKATGGTFNLENDIAFIYVYADDTTGFTPSSANFVGRIPCSIANLLLGIDAIGGFQVPDGASKFVKITAVDKSGNESVPSSEVTATALLIDSININDAAITNAKIGDLAVTNAKVADLSAVKITAGTIGAHQIIIGSGGDIESSNYTPGSAGWIIQGDGVAEFSQVTVRGNITSSTIDSSTITGGTFRTASSGKRVEISQSSLEYIHFYTGDASETQPGYIWDWVTSGAADRQWLLELKAPTVFGVPALGSSAYLRLWSKAADDTIPSRATLAADPDTYLDMSQNNSIYLQSFADHFIALEQTEISTWTAGDGDWISLINGGYVSFQVRQSLGYTDARLAGIPPSSTDALLRWSTSSGQLWYDSSSSRFKHGIKDFEQTYSLDSIDQLRVVSYRETDKTTDVDKGQDFIGVIAEEVYEVFPSLVTLDTEGEPLSVAYEKLAAVAIAAVQDLRTRVEVLENGGKKPTQPKKPKIKKPTETAETKKRRQEQAKHRVRHARPVMPTQPEQTG